MDFWVDCLDLNPGSMTSRLSDPGEITPTQYLHLLKQTQKTHGAIVKVE